MNGIKAAFGEVSPDIVLKNGKVLNVFTNELEEIDVAIHDGFIVGLGEYQGINEYDMEGKIISPGFIDGHIHLESSMISPKEFARAVVPHGTTAVITDPHEIANVSGTTGIDYMLASTEGLPMDVFFMLPSCVPATPIDEAGATLLAKDLEPYYSNARVLGLAELMNAYGTVRSDKDIVDKIISAKSNNKLIDGHGPDLTGKELNAYVFAGVTSDHECCSFNEALEKLRRGQWIMIREGTAAKNLSALIPLFGKRYYQRCMLVTDDKHPGDLIRRGHIDYIIREAVKRGADPIHAIKMGSLHAAQYFGLKEYGAVAPGYRANLAILNNLEDLKVTDVFYNGKLVAKDGKALGQNIEQSENQVPKELVDKVYNSFHAKETKPEDFIIKKEGKFQRVIGLTKGELLTKELIVPLEKDSLDKNVGVDIERDIVKMAVIERHKDTGHIGLGFLYGYGLKEGAVASSIAHDSHNLIVAGTNDEDISLAANTVIKNHGGLAVVNQGKVLGELKLPIAGLMCDVEAENVDEILTELKEITSELGVSNAIDPFMTLAFASLPVIPELRLTTKGLVHVNEQKLVDVVFD